MSLLSGQLVCYSCWPQRFCCVINDQVNISAIGVASYGALGHVPPQLSSNCLIFSGHVRAAQTLTLDSMGFTTVKEYTGYSFIVTVSCMNFITFLCAP